MAAPWLMDLLATPDLASWQTHALAFLLGSYAVATLSDLKYMSAQREFLEVWALVGLTLFGLELWWEWRPDATFAVKWGLIAVLALLSWQKVGVIFRLARGDVFAMVATAALLPPLLILAYWVIAWVVAAVFRATVMRGRAAWPFMPVVSIATLAVLLVMLLGPF